MKPKQREMDRIVEHLFRALESKEHLGSTLLVLCGDHGMNEGGNHGGAAEGETSTALVFMSPKLQSISNGLLCPIATPSLGTYQYYTTVEQSDVAPTLAGLLDFPVPMNNLGTVIPQFLSLWEQGWWILTLSRDIALADFCRSTPSYRPRERAPDSKHCTEHVLSIRCHRVS